MRITAWGALLTVSVVALGWLVWLLSDGDLDRYDKIASIAGVPISLISLAVSAFSLRLQFRQQPTTSPEDATVLGRAAEALANTVRNQWEDEAGLRQLRRPAPLRLTWSTPARPIAAPAATIAGNTITGRVMGAAPSQ